MFLSDGDPSIIVVVDTFDPDVVDVVDVAAPEIVLLILVRDCFFGEKVLRGKVFGKKSQCQKLFYLVLYKCCWCWFLLVLMVLMLLL